MNSNYFIAIAIVLVVGVVYCVGYQHGKSKTQVQYLEKEKLVRDSTYSDSLKGIFSSKIDSLARLKNYYKYKSLSGKIDTFFIHDTTKIGSPLKIASSDTLITKDSTLVLKIKYLFPPINKFDVLSNIKQKIKIVPEIKLVDKPETFRDKFGCGINVGVGYGFFHKQVDTYLGIGFYFKIY